MHVVDGSSPQPEYEFDAVRLELELFNPELADKQSIVAYNKMDLPEASDKWEAFKEYLQSKGIEPFCMSAVKNEGTYAIACAAYELVKEVKEAENTIKGVLLIDVIMLFFYSCLLPLLDIQNEV